MKQLDCIGLAFLLIFGILCTSVNAMEVADIQCGEHFMPGSIEVGPNGTVLLAGSIGEPMHEIPTIISCDFNGTMLWSMHGGAMQSADLYREAKYIDGDKILGVRSVTEGQSVNFVVEVIRDKQVLHRSDPMKNIFHVYPIKDGFLVYSKPDFSSARITKMDLEANVVWQLDLDEPIMFNGILARTDMYVAYGKKSTQKDDIECPATSIMVAIDDQGNIIWRQDSKSNEEYIVAAWINQGNILVAGNRYGDEANKLEGSFFAEFNGDTEQWRTYEPNELNSDIDLVTMVSIDDGYLIATRSLHQRSAVDLLKVDKNGALLCDWEEPIGDLYSAFHITLANINDHIYIIVYGETKMDEDEEDFYAQAPRKVIIKEIVWER